jgi:hypothetical protein
VRNACVALTRATRTQALHDPATQAVRLPTLLASTVDAMHTLVADSDRVPAIVAALQLALKIVGKLFALRRALDDDDDDDDNDDDNNAAEPTVERPRSTLLAAIRRYNAFVVLFVRQHKAQLLAAPTVTSPRAAGAVRSSISRVSAPVSAVSPTLQRACELTWQLLVSLDVAVPNRVSMLAVGV